MMNGHTTLLDFHEKLEAFRRFDSERDALIQVQAAPSVGPASAHPCSRDSGNTTKM